MLLLDVSGSMDSPDKLPLAQQSMALLLDTLKPTDTVGIVVYAGAAGMVLAPTPVRREGHDSAGTQLASPGGSTAGAAKASSSHMSLPEKHFRKNGVNRILLATDGDFNVGISNENELKGFVQRERENGVFLSVLGFGLGNYQDETAQVLAQNGNGAAAYIDSLSEAKKVLVQQSTGALFTIAKDVKLQVEFNPATVSEYRLVGYETRALNREDFNNDKVDAGDVGCRSHGDRDLRDPARWARVRSSSASVATLRRRMRACNRSPWQVERVRVPQDPLQAAERVSVAADGAADSGGRGRAGKPSQRSWSSRPPLRASGSCCAVAQYTGSLSYEEVMQQAEDGLSQDPHGYRREFVELVRKAARMKDGR